MPWEKAFDRDRALKVAIETFWEHGYESTSMSDLLKAMGINRGSFYDTFGSKRDLLIEATQSYLQSRAFDMEQRRRGRTHRQAIQDFFEWIIHPSGPRHNRWGCLAVNLTLELSLSDPQIRTLINAAFAAHEAYFRRLIEGGQDAGEIRRDLDAAEAAQGLLAMVFGIRVFSRSGIRLKTLTPLIDQAMHLLD